MRSNNNSNCIKACRRYESVTAVGTMIRGKYILLKILLFSLNVLEVPMKLSQNRFHSIIPDKEKRTGGVGPVGILKNFPTTKIYVIKVSRGTKSTHRGPIVVC
jgi:hypothetical protein